MRELVCCLILSAGASAWAAPGSVSMPSLWRYAHPEAKALVGIEWRRIVNSPLGLELRQKLAEANPGQMQDIDIIDSVGRLFISSPGNPPGAPEGNQPPAVIAVQGQFDLERIRQLAAEKMTGSSDYLGVEVLESEQAGQEPVGLALVSDRLLLLGDIASLQGAIDHHAAGDPGQASNPLFLRAAELSGTNDIWVVAEASPADFSKDGAAAMPMLKDVERIEVGVSFQSGLGLEVNLGARSPESAAELAAGAKLMLGMLLASHQPKDGGPNLAEKLQIGAEQSLVKLALQLSQDELQSGLRQWTSSVKAGVMASAASGGAESAAGQAWGWEQNRSETLRPPPRDRKVKIYGLEEGTREIEMRPE